MNSITLQNVKTSEDQLSFTFDVLNFPDGIPTQSRPVLEPLQSKGVDGALYRDIGEQFKQFSAIAIKFHATFEEAVRYGHDIERCQSNFLGIESDQHGSHTAVLCVAVNTKIIPCTGVGANVPTGTQARTVSVFELVYA